MTDPQVYFNDVVSTYANRPTPLTPLGHAVFKRTYANWLPQLYGAGAAKRSEHWHEVIKRVVEWSVSLVPYKHPSDRLSEMMELYDALFHAQGFVSGRTMFAAGKDIPGEAHFNCAFHTEKSATEFGNTLALLMSGAGVGGRNTFEDVALLNEQLPMTIQPHVEIQNFNDDLLDRPLKGRPETQTALVDLNGAYMIKQDRPALHISVGDSREGWREAVIIFLNRLSQGGDVVLDGSQIRPYGAALSRMGGYASGPEPFAQAIKDILRVIFRGPKGWTGVKTTEVRNIMGQLAVAAGTRRSAEISLGDSKDEDFSTMKDFKHFKFNEKGEATDNAWRFQSNNSNIYFDKPSREELLQRLQTAHATGEPGFINGAAALKRRSDWRGLNPCAEILLTDEEFCNLASVNLPSFVMAGGKIDKEGLERTVRLLTRHMLRVTHVQLSPFLGNWQRNLERDRLLGLSITGVYDLLGKTGISLEELKALVQHIRYWSHDAAIAYAYELRVPTPLLVTTIKPEGTLSKLTDSSSGLHPKYAPLYLQRMIVNKNTPVFDALNMANVPWEDKHNDPKSAVFEFPMRGEGSVHAKRMGAIEQLEMYKLMMENFVDHNASVSVYFNQDEIPAIADWLDANWDSYVAVSFFAKSDVVYKQQPWEEIGFTEYERRYKELGQNFESNFLQALEIYESSKGAVDDDLESCDTGACPVR